ncbi:MAG TPA: EamA family transporter [Polyangia bacterium]|nr:EamA family transporter [Polyangia bacterium]
MPASGPSLGAPLALGAVLLALGASVSWALANVAVARSARLVGAVRALLWAEVAGGALAALAAWLGDVDVRTEAFTATTAVWLAVAGAAALLGYLSMFHALEHGRLAIAVPIMSGWAVISTAISLLLLRESVRPVQLGGAALVILGVLLVSRRAGQAAGAAARAGAARARAPRWLWASFGAALGFGVLIPAVAQVAPATGRVGSVVAVFATDILLGLPLAVWFRVDLRPPPRRAWVPVGLAGLFETAGFVCIALAGARAPLAVVSPLASLASALTVLYAWVVLRDRPHPVALAGAVLATAGVLVLAS